MSDKKSIRIIFYVLLIIDLVLSVFCLINFAKTIDENGEVAVAWWRTVFHIAPITLILIITVFLIFLNDKIFSCWYNNHKFHRTSSDISMIPGGNDGVPAEKEILHKRFRIMTWVYAVIAFVFGVLGCIFS